MPPIFLSYMDLDLGRSCSHHPGPSWPKLGPRWPCGVGPGRSAPSVRADFCGRAVMSLPDLCVPTRLERMLHPL